MAAPETEAFYSSLSSSPWLMGQFESESKFSSLFMADSGRDSEHMREMSFLFWPPGVPLPAAVKDLVTAGFYYTGDGQTIACYSCNVKVPLWKDRADALTMHYELSANCLHLRSLKEKEQRNQQMNKRRKSQKTSRQNSTTPNSTCALSCSHTPSSSQQSDCYACVDNCQNQVSTQEEQNTRLLQRHQLDSERDDNDLKQQQKRLETFSASCPKNVLQVRLNLADAGFFYTGRSDIVKCAFCKGELHAAKIGSNHLWESHIKFFPDCSFAKACSESLMNQAAESALSERTAEHIVKPFKNQTTTFSPSDHLLRLKAENKKLRTSVTCVRCHSAQVQTLMLPCCHIVCCETCAEAVDDCPLCTARILGTVKIFMS